MSGSWMHCTLDRRSASYWRVTFDHPPINTITATTVSELSELVGLEFVVTQRLGAGRDPVLCENSIHQATQPRGSRTSINRRGAHDT